VTRLRRTLQPVQAILLVIALLFAQQAALTHAIGHDLAREHKSAGVGAKGCETCSLATQFGSAMVSHGPDLIPLLQSIARAGYGTKGFVPRLRLAFASRAPPVFS